MAKQDVMVSTDKGEFKGTLVEGHPYIGIREATAYLGLKHAQYTRRLLLEGKLDGPETEEGEFPFRAEKVAYEGFKKWYIAVSALSHYEANKRRNTSGRRFTLWIDLEDESKARTALDSAKVEYKMEVSYKPKTKE